MLFSPLCSIVSKAFHSSFLFHLFCQRCQESSLYNKIFEALFIFLWLLCFLYLTLGVLAVLLLQYGVQRVFYKLDSQFYFTFFITNALNTFALYGLVGRLIGILLVSRSGLVGEDAIEVFHYHGFQFFLDVQYQVYSGKIIMW